MVRTFAYEPLEESGSQTYSSTATIVRRQRVLSVFCWIGQWTQQSPSEPMISIVVITIINTSTVIMLGATLPRSPGAFFNPTCPTIGCYQSLALSKVNP